MLKDKKLKTKKLTPLQKAKKSYLKRLKNDIEDEFRYTKQAYINQENKLKNSNIKVDNDYFKNDEHFYYYLEGKLATKNFILWAVEDMIKRIGTKEEKEDEKGAKNEKI